MATVLKLLGGPEHEPDIKAIALVRKSSKDAGKQIASLERQRTEIQKLNPSIQKWWSEEGSGTRDDRDSIDEILAWCKANPRSKSKPGKFYVWEWSRFARPVYREGGQMVTDPLAGVGMIAKFWEYGWKLVDALVGDQDGILYLLHASLGMDKSGSESATLQKRVRSGRNKKFDEGWHIGRPPWCCVRVDAETGKVISHGKQGNQTKVILKGKPKRVRLWKYLAKTFLNGATYASLVTYLNERGIPSGPNGEVRWNQTGVRNLLTNVKLIGYLEKRTEGSASAQTFRYLDKPVRVKANWDPIVPVKLFRAVQKEVERRKNADKRQRSDTSAFLLRPSCSRCGEEFTSCTVRGYRYYRHPILKPVSAEKRKRMMAAGCSIAFYVRADLLEEKVHEKILSCRSSEEYAQQVQQLIESRIGVVSDSRVVLKRLEKEKEELEAAYMHTVRAHISAQSRGLPEEPYLEEMARVHKRLEELSIEIPEAQDAASTDVNVWESVREMMQELSAIAVGWSAASNDQKRYIYEQWIRSLVLAAEPNDTNPARAGKRVGMLELRLLPGMVSFDLEAVSNSDTSLYIDMPETELQTRFSLEV